MKTKWWLLAAGIALSSARWWKHVEPLAPVEDEMVVDEKAARAAGDFEIELTRARRAPRTKRVASALLFVTLFCAGAAFTAGAGNELVSTDETTAVAEAAEPSPDLAAEAAAAPAVPAAPAPEPAAAPVEEAAAPAPAPEATPPAEEPAPSPAAGDAAAPDDVTPSSAPTRPDYVAPEPAHATASTARRAKTAATTPKVRRTRTVTKTSPPAPQVVVAATPFFVPAVPFDLTAWEHDNPGSTTGTAAVAIAQHFVGTPYVWGGSSPTGGFDCSGLMLYVYAQLGVPMPHYAASQFALFAKLQPNELQPGDLVFFEPKIDGPGHVAMYAGGDAIIEAPHTGALVRIGSLSRSAAALGFMGAVRPYTAGVRAARTVAQHHRSARAQASGIGTASSIFAA